MIKLFEYLKRTELEDLGVEFYTLEFIDQTLKSKGSLTIWGGFNIGEDKNGNLWIVNGALKWNKTILNVNATYSPLIRESELILWFLTLEDATKFSERVKGRITGPYEKDWINLNMLKSEISYNLARLK